jgi:ATP-dependent exoDNAse (exonuclease V) beta subunit
VAVGDFTSDADANTQEREAEETRRLLYVAVTRARERLYLSAVLKDGRFKPGRGSLGEVLPEGAREIFAKAAASADGTQVEWQAAEGVHRFRVCAAAGGGQHTVERSAGATMDAGTGEPRAPAPVDDFAPWRDQAHVRAVPVTAVVSREVEPRSPDEREPGDGGRIDRRLAGTLVHRLFQAVGSAADGLEPEVLAERATALAFADDLAGAEDAKAVIEEAVASFVALRSRPDVTALLETANCLYEVPFSMEGEAGGTTNPPGSRAVIRGTIDCLACLPDGRLVVVEIKTGRPHAWHEEQLAWYVRAAQVLFPGSEVEGKVFYA